MLRFLHQLEVNIPYPPGFFKVIINGTEISGHITSIVVDNSWQKQARNAEMGWYLDGEQD